MSSKRDLQPLLDTQQNQLNLVFSDSNGIDAKALAILGANIAALLFIDAAKLHVVVWQAILLFGPFVVSLALDVVSIWPRKYLLPLSERGSTGHYLNLSGEALQLQLLANIETSIRHNSALNKQRLRLCMISIAFTGLGFLALLFIL